MPDSSSFVQRCLLEIRFTTRPSMLARGGEILDRWVKEGCELDIQGTIQRVVDPNAFISVSTTYNNVVIDVEGMNDFSEFIKLAQRLAKDTLEILGEIKLERIGFRYWKIVPGVEREKANNIMLDVLTAQGWEGGPEINKITDLATVLEFTDNLDAQGRLHFGPWVPQANLSLFRFKDHPQLKDTTGGYIFDIDFGCSTKDTSKLKTAALAKLLSEGYSISEDRIRRASLMLKGKD